jgi:ferredoxin
MSVDYDRIPRQEMPKLGKRTARPVPRGEPGYGEAQAIAESDRCLKCNFNIEIIGELCIICGGCVDVCPMDVIHMVDMSDIVDDGAIPGSARRRSGRTASRSSRRDRVASAALSVSSDPDRRDHDEPCTAR